MKRELICAAWMAFVPLLGQELALSQSHPVPCGSRDNQLELTVENGSPSAVTHVKAEVTSAPSWMHITPSQRILGAVEGGKEIAADFKFAIDNSAQVGENGTITFAITSAGQRWNKTIMVAVSAPERFELLQNYPNPFNPETKIEYMLPSASSVRLTIYNVLGEEIATLVDTREDAGGHVASWDASTFPSGMYFYRLRAGDYIETRSMLLVR